MSTTVKSYQGYVGGLIGYLGYDFKNSNSGKVAIDISNCILHDISFERTESLTDSYMGGIIGYCDPLDRATTTNTSVRESWHMKIKNISMSVGNEIDFKYRGCIFGGINCRANTTYDLWDNNHGDGVVYANIENIVISRFPLVYPKNDAGVVFGVVTGGTSYTFRDVFKNIFLNSTYVDASMTQSLGSTSNTISNLVIKNFEQIDRIDSARPTYFNTNNEYATCSDTIMANLDSGGTGTNWSYLRIFPYNDSQRYPVPDMYSRSMYYIKGYDLPHYGDLVTGNFDLSGVINSMSTSDYPYNESFDIIYHNYPISRSVPKCPTKEISFDIYYVIDGEQTTEVREYVKSGESVFVSFYSFKAVATSYINLAQKFYKDPTDSTLKIVTEYYKNSSGVIQGISDNSYKDSSGIITI